MVKRHYKVIWNKQARTSLRKIYNYIKKRESEQQAVKVRDEIRELGQKSRFYAPQIRQGSTYRKGDWRYPLQSHLEL